MKLPMEGIITVKLEEDKPLMSQDEMPRNESPSAVPEVGLVSPEGSVSEHISYSSFVAKLFKPFASIVDRLDHAGIGIAGEAGEVLDEIKQLTMYGKELNLEKLQSELGDTLFYIQAICNEFHWDIDYLCQINANKLTARYAKLYYTDEQAVERADGEVKGAGDHLL